jgi:hypothetical protein
MGREERWQLKIAVLKSSVVLDCTMLSSRLFQSIAVLIKKELLYCFDLASGTFTLLLLIRDWQRTYTDTDTCKKYPRIYMPI